MVIYDGDANQPETPRGGLFSRYLFSTNHQVIGLAYLWLALLSVFLGMAMSLVMRIHLVWPGARVPFFSAFGDTPQRYATLALLHGSLRSEEHTSELQSRRDLVCRLLLEKKKKIKQNIRSNKKKKIHQKNFSNHNTHRFH